MQEEFYGVFLEGSYRFLLVLHMLFTFVLVGTMSHNLTIVAGYLRGNFGKKKLEQYYVKISLWAYVIVYLLGGLIYPAFRILVRYQYFDPELPWATGLFEVKEHWAALGLAFLFAWYFLRRSFDPEQQKQKLFLYVPLCFILNLILWYTVVVSCYLTLLKGS